MKTYNETIKERKGVPYKEPHTDIFENALKKTESAQDAAVPARKTVYNPDVNYTAQQKAAEGAGNYAHAMDNEYMHNMKDGAMGLGWGVSGRYNYLDPNGYGGLMQAKYDEIENYQPFGYDYMRDDTYKAIRDLKEKEAEKAYADGYAQLSGQFDGDIPANMINKLLTTKSEIAGEADSYIPKLKQMAYDMYNVEKNDLYNQYGLLKERAGEDYSKWQNDRDFYVTGLENAYNREWNQKQLDYNRERDAVSDSRYQQEFDYNKELNDREFNNGMTTDKINLAKALYEIYGDFDAAYRAAEKYYNGVM